MMIGERINQRDNGGHMNNTPNIIWSPIILILLCSPLYYYLASWVADYCPRENRRRHISRLAPGRRQWDDKMIPIANQKKKKNIFCHRWPHSYLLSKHSYYYLLFSLCVGREFERIFKT